MPVTTYPIVVGDETAEIGAAAELVVALDVLHGQHDRAVLEQLRPHLAEILGGRAGLYAVLRVLEPTDQVYVLEAVGSRLVDVVETPAALRDILATLGHAEVEECLLRTLGGEGLRRLIRTPEELAGVLEWVYGGQDELALELLGPEFLRRLFQTGHELSLVLKALDEARQEELLGELGWEHIVSLMHDDQDLAYSLRALPAALSRRLLEHFSGEQLRDVVRDEHALQTMSRVLEADEAAALRERLGAATDAE